MNGTKLRRHGQSKKRERNPKRQSQDSGSDAVTGRKDFVASTHSSDLNDGYDVELSLVLGLVTFGVYYTTLYPSLPGGDSGELIAAAHELGVAHPPGYPLFTVLAWLAIRLVPFGTVAWRVNLLAAVFGGMTIVCLSLTILRLTHRPSAAVLAVGLWGWSKLTWAWSITAEVFSLNNFFVSFLLLLALKFEEAEDQQQQMKMALIGSFVCGLSLSNQHTMVVYVFCLAVWVLYTLHRDQGLSFRIIVKIGLTFLAGLLPYLYLPLSGWLVKSRWTWGDHRSIDGFLTHLLRREYGTFDLSKGGSGQGVLFSLRAYSDHIYEDLTLVVCALFVVGLISVVHRYLKTNAKSVAVFLVMMIIYLLFFSWRANLDLQNPLYLGVVERFWMQSDIVLVMIAALSFNDIFRFLSHTPKFTCKYIDYVKLDIVLAALLSIYQLHRHYNLSDQSTNWVVHEYGEDVLKTLPPNAIILTKGDLPSNTFRYLCLCENVRPDIQIFDQEVLTYPWSVPVLGWTMPNITFPGDMFHLKNEKRPDGRVSFTFRRFLDANYQRSPIFGCIGVQDHEHSWKAGYTLIPYGSCSQFVKNGDTFEIMQHVQAIQNIAKHWTHSPDGFPETSWEHVTTGVMWNAKISTAYFLYDQSQNAKDVQEKTNTMLLSYQLYTEALKNNPGFPAYWHKNYALACERMLYVTHSYNKKELLQKSIHHFEMFLKLDPHDVDAKHVVNAIKTLKERLRSWKD